MLLFLCLHIHVVSKLDGRARLIIIYVQYVCVCVCVCEKVADAVILDATCSEVWCLFASLKDCVLFVFTSSFFFKENLARMGEGVKLSQFLERNNWYK